MARSWGGFPYVDQAITALGDRHAALPTHEFLPFGAGRSYGDSCLNSRAGALATRWLDKFIAFDAERGLLTCESGVTLAQIIAAALPRGWFLPATPGTQFVTVGGAIANDVHGKNHHVEGTFGCHVLQFELLRSDGSRLLCTPHENSEWFRATIGGLGLTGVITWAQLQLKRVHNNVMDVETIKYASLRDFFSLSAQSDRDYEYTVAWVDCLASGQQVGRGHFMRANHAPLGVRDLPSSARKLRVPYTPPVSLINALSLRLFNTAYYHRQQRQAIISQQHFDPFFYPLDSIHNWNRIYGRKGFLQFQCAIPQAVSEPVIVELLQRIAAAGLGSFLAVLKVFGDKKSPGLMSFPLPGATLALDFPMLGDKTLALFRELDATVIRAGGRIYPAKDAAMSRDAFRHGYPQWKQLETLRDPNINSDFWRRVTGEF